jgi:hypothetical protein
VQLELRSSLTRIFGGTITRESLGFAGPGASSCRQHMARGQFHRARAGVSTVQSHAMHRLWTVVTALFFPKSNPPPHLAIQLHRDQTHGCVQLCTRTYGQQVVFLSSVTHACVHKKNVPFPLFPCLHDPSSFRLLSSFCT